MSPDDTYPRGKADDDGELMLRMAEVDGSFLIEFSKPTTWIGFGPREARALAERLLEFADRHTQ